MSLSKYSVVHEVSGRLRLRVSALAEPQFDAAYLETWLESVHGVDAVRTNRPAHSLVIAYTGGGEVRNSVLRRLTQFSPDTQDGPFADVTGDGAVVSMVARLGSLALLPLLPMAAQKVVTFAVVGSTLAKGLDTFIRAGVKVEVLDALAIGLSAARGEVYTATITGFLLALGEYLEQRTERQSDHLLRRLLQPQPVMAWVERDGDLVQVLSDEVVKGETVTVGLGETVPVDGRVIEGVALVNQSAITGEDVPVRKESPRRVVSGSVVVEGRMRIEAIQVGDETTTARVARFIQESLGKRSETQRMADALADKRVYLTLGTGGLVYGLTRDLTRLESVFLVDYSCALKLGTPVAFKSGMYRAAGNGVLMKGGAAIERLAEVDTVVFDKTGTLTHSELAVTEVQVLADGLCSNEELLALVASVEEHASHPVAKAVVDAARERELDHITHGEIEYLVAHGMTAEVSGGQIYIGSRHYLEEHLGLSFADHETLIDSLQDEGKILLFVGNRNGPVGLIALRDRLRADALATLARLRELGVRRLVMITGDRAEKARALGAELGLDEVYAEMPPEDKASVIERLQQAGGRVAFVGDGVNDGPALAASDVGIAMPRGSDIARATADIVLMDDRLSAVADARDIAGRTMRLIRTNFNLAVGINTAILGGAVLGWLSPVASAVLHNGTTIGILLNALSGVSLPQPTGQQAQR